MATSVSNPTRRADTAPQRVASHGATLFVVLSILATASCLYASRLRDVAAMRDHRAEVHSFGLLMQEAQARVGRPHVGYAGGLHVPFDVYANGANAGGSDGSPP